MHRSTNINTDLHIIHRIVCLLVILIHLPVLTRGVERWHTAGQKQQKLQCQYIPLWSIRFRHTIKTPLTSEECVCVWTYCCLTDSRGNYSSTVAVTPAQPLRLSPCTLAPTNPCTEAKGKTFTWKYLLNDRGEKCRQREGEDERTLRWPTRREEEMEMKITRKKII